MYQRLKGINHLTTIFTVVLLLGCELASDYNILVSVKNNRGQPVQGAEIWVDKQKVGSSDKNGFLESSITLKQDREYRLEVLKESKKFYFAPYFKRFTVKSEGIKDSNHDKAVKFEAVLYSVPKPKINGKESSLAVEDKSPAKEKNNTDTRIEIAETGEDTQKDVVVKKKEENYSDSNEKLSLEIENDKDKSKEKKYLELPNEENIDVLNTKTLSPVVAKTSDTLPLSDQPYPLKKIKSSGDHVFTIQAFNKSRSLSGVTIYKGLSDKGELREVCKTSKLGRCSVRFKVDPHSKVTFVAKKDGFRTVSKNIRVRDNGVLRFDLKKGNTIDFFATTRRYNYTKGLEGADVFIDGSVVGKTDSFGRFSYFHTGEKEDLIEVMIKPQGYLPEFYQTDFVIQGPMTVIKYFTPVVPPRARIGVLPLRILGSEDNDDLVKYKGVVRPIITKKMSKIKAFKRVGISSIQKAFEESNLTISYALKRGWLNTPLKGSVDALLLPTLSVIGDDLRLEISLIDSQGRILAAARENLNGDNLRKIIFQTATTLLEKIQRLFPFEGTIISADDKPIINIGSSHGRALKVKDKVYVWGVQRDKTGNKREHKHIATLSIEDVKEKTSSTVIEWRASRSVLERGDLVQLQRTVNKNLFISKKKFKSINNSYFKVITADKKPVSRANIYLKNIWVGSTDKNGLLKFPTDLIGESGTVQVTKSGFSSLTKDLKLEKNKTITIFLEQKSAYLRVESKPSGGAVSVDGKYIGSTPLAKGIKVPSGFVQIEIDGKLGYKKFKQIFEFNEGTLDLTGPQRILLEVDFLKPALDLIAQGKIELGLQKLDEIEPSHSDYLKARHSIAEVYLTLKNEPAVAIEEFKKVTLNPGVKSYQDKRFISAFVNLAVSHFKMAERLGESRDWEKVVEHYRKSVHEFEKVKPYLRFISKSEYASVVHSVGFYLALSKHRIALIKKDRALLERAVDDWRDYVDGIGSNVAIGNDATGAFLDNARIYLRQARVSLTKKAF